MTVREIIADLARRRRVEQVVRLQTGHDRLTPTEEDACQIIYEILLNYDPHEVERMQARDKIDGWIFRTSRNVLWGDGSHSVRRLHAFTEICDPFPPGI